MLYSKLFGRTSKSEGINLKITSHRLLVRAGYIRESTAGRYYFLPLGQILQNKLISLIRRAMNDSGALEVLSPVLHPLSLWQETNRDRAAGFELMQLRDRRDTGFALGGTAEEMFVDLVRGFNLSYKDLPLNLYQFGLKFRDELRVRGGLLRSREFIMKDAYSFSSESQFEQVYELMKQVYTNIFQAVGLETVVVPADGGYIGGEYCHEFIVKSKVGESVYLQAGDYLAHEDIAVFSKTISVKNQQPATLTAVKAVRGPTMAESLKYHQPVPLTQHIKNVVYLNDKEEIILACLRGDLEVNEVKLAKATLSSQLRPLAETEIKLWLGSYPGFISPVNLKPQSDHKLIVVADDSLQEVVNAISGANLKNEDYLNINLGRDFQADLITDIALAKDGYLAHNGQVLQTARGIEVGNIFQLGYHYSAKMKGAEYIDAQGKRQAYYMGCYGIGIGRTLAAVAEVFSDDKGLVWPASITPYQVQLVTLNHNIEIHEQALVVMESLQAEGITVLYDDRDLSAGEKLADADLLGFPIRVVLSTKTLAKEQAEIKLRRQADLHHVDLNQTASRIQELLRNID